MNTVKGVQLNMYRCSKNLYTLHTPPLQFDVILIFDTDLSKCDILNESVVIMIIHVVNKNDVTETKLTFN